MGPKAELAGFPQEAIDHHGLLMYVIYCIHGVKSLPQGFFGEMCVLDFLKKFSTWGSLTIKDL